MKLSRLHNEKKKNSKAGFDEGKIDLITGKRIMTIAADIQLAITAYERILGWAISGRYTHTTGPKVKPKLPIKRINPKMIKVSDKSGED